ncbi:MAG: polyphosphate polymerase domain-containing protein [Verrucomicrobia bacterium]|nr:polyphosphate polymerase domain-containing protein [Verrucomicrobiota bacterium]
MQSHRFELKYIIPHELALQIRDFIQAYLVLDSFGASQPDCSYPVHSLYLDSRDLYLHQSTINGERNRYKLRIRFYENRPGAPIYLEIKRRENNAIYKERCALRREAVEDIAMGRIPCRSELVKAKPENERALFNFCRYLNQLQARPVAHVYYRREAWSSFGSNRYRITFDRNVTTSPDHTYRLDPKQNNPISVFGDFVVLELKFTERFPPWMGDLVRIFGIRQCSAAKYVDGIVRLEEEQIIATGLCAHQQRLRKQQLHRKLA